MPTFSLTPSLYFLPNCIIENYCWFGVNSTIRNNLLLKEGSLISMSACLTKNTEEYNIYMGVPAKSVGKSNDEKISMSL